MGPPNAMLMLASTWLLERLATLSSLSDLCSSWPSFAIPNQPHHSQSLCHPKPYCPFFVAFAFFSLAFLKLFHSSILTYNHLLFSVSLSILSWSIKDTNRSNTSHNPAWPYLNVFL